MKNSVLIVDDEIFYHQYFADMIEPLGYHVVGYGKTGDEAVNLTFSLMPDIIIMNYNMPLMNGAVASQKILAVRPQTKIILTSSKKINDQQIKGFGIIGVLSAPFTLQKLVKILLKISSLNAEAE